MYFNCGRRLKQHNPCSFFPWPDRAMIRYRDHKPQPLQSLFPLINITLHAAHTLRETNYLVTGTACNQYVHWIRFSDASKWGDPKCQRNVTFIVTWRRQWQLGCRLNDVVFRRVHKTAKSDCLFHHVCPSVRMGKLGSHRTDFHEIWYLQGFRKSVEKIQVSLISEKNKGYFTWRPLPYLAHFSLEWEIFQTKVVNKIKKHILSSVIFFSKIVSFMRIRGKILYSRTGHRWQYGACALHVG